LTLHNTTEPTVNLSVNGGKTIPVLGDSGSEGLVVPLGVRNDPVNRSRRDVRKPARVNPRLRAQATA
jgi:hypothetical protein